MCWCWLLNPKPSFIYAAIVLSLQASKQQHRTGKIMLEGWVDDVLTSSQLHPQQSTGQQGRAKGAAAAGLARQQLLAAGLSSGTADQLYRCLYVYSMGFVDTIKVGQAGLLELAIPEALHAAAGDWVYAALLTAVCPNKLTEDICKGGCRSALTACHVQRTAIHMAPSSAAQLTG